MDDDVFMARFEAAQWDADQWHHREHIKIAYLYLTRLGVEGALARVRAGIQRLNARHGVPESPTRGYHETMTCAWLQLVYLSLCEYGANESADDFYEANPQLSEKKALRFFYSKERLMSERAKYEFVEPDLAPLPRSNKAFPQADKEPGKEGAGRVLTAL
jgi:hypothetical protein